MHGFGSAFGPKQPYCEAEVREEIQRARMCASGGATSPKRCSGVGVDVWVEGRVEQMLKWRSDHVMLLRRKVALEDLE